jgi:hypothetical protein
MVGKVPVMYLAGTYSRYMVYGINKFGHILSVVLPESLLYLCAHRDCRRNYV